MYYESALKRGSISNNWSDLLMWNEGIGDQSIERKTRPLSGIPTFCHRWFTGEMKQKNVRVDNTLASGSSTCGRRKESLGDLICPWGNFSSELRVFSRVCCHDLQAEPTRADGHCRVLHQIRE